MTQSNRANDDFKTWLSKPENYIRGRKVVHSTIKAKNFLNLGTDEIDDIYHTALLKILKAEVKYLEIVDEKVMEKKISSLIGVTASNHMKDRFRAFKRRSEKCSMVVPLSYEAIASPSDEEERSISQISELMCDDTDIVEAFLQLKDILSRNKMLRKFFKYRFIKQYSYGEISERMAIGRETAKALEVHFISLFDDEEEEEEE